MLDVIWPLIFYNSGHIIFAKGCCLAISRSSKMAALVAKRHPVWLRIFYFGRGVDQVTDVENTLSKLSTKSALGNNSLHYPGKVRKMVISQRARRQQKLVHLTFWI